MKNLITPKFLSENLSLELKISKIYPFSTLSLSIIALDQMCDKMSPNGGFWYKNGGQRWSKSIKTSLSVLLANQYRGNGRPIQCIYFFDVRLADQYAKRKNWFGAKLGPKM